MGEKQGTSQKVLAMYDIRGIQDYIFRTTRVKDAIGASAIVEDIIEDAMQDAVDKLREEGETFIDDLTWYDKKGVQDFHMKEAADIQVLYVGGGNAFFLFRDQELCRKINRHMSRYVIGATYSLQLAIAVTEYKGNYKEDYERINREMNRVKETMVVSRPLGSLPVMVIDAKTGYPLVSDTKGNWMSVQEEKVEETIQKKDKERNVREKIKTAEKIFDNYITQKGTDSTLAVVHIDGNNMGLRIREQIEGIEDYDKAVNTMRRISYRINHSYKKVFEQMASTFNQDDKQKEKQYKVLKILTAGDDITYVCNGKLALATVQYFAKEIAGYTMDGQITDRPEKGDTGYAYPVHKETKEDNLKRYGFSVCAGIAYIHSHFPFYVGYETAEACCESAKKRAKDKKYCGQNGRIGNWVDFQICKNIQAQNLDEVRQKEYVTALGESLMLRPYYISTDTDFGMEKQVDSCNTLEQFMTDVAYFQDEKHMPRSFSKDLRNTYPQGKKAVNMLYAFLKSRGWKLPDGTDALYVESAETDCSDQETENKNKESLARWYDALEMMDYVENRTEEAQTGGENE